MPAALGSRLGQYEIITLLGAGGMGEVYRAKDTKLGRDVALKILPASFTSDPERVARFRREAQVLASLNHPHIAQIYGLEEANDTQFLVLELVDGKSLDRRILHGPIPVDEALGIAKQIAEALEAAHEKGIIHRDLKPANIALTTDGTVKVLDFGLAKATDSASGVVGDAMNSPTITSPAMMTGVGVILGTAAYMSPEQAKGLAADRRSDIWAFGCVLYEMLTGRRAFSGTDATDIIAAIIRIEPDLNALPASTPEPSRRLLRRCLEKDRRRRLADAADARLEIDDALTSPTADSSALPAPRRLLSVAFATLVGGALIASILTWAITRPIPQPLTRFAIVPPAAQPLMIGGYDRDLALSPDGRQLVYRSGGSILGGPLMVRTIDSLDVHPLAGVTTARWPFFSPDSRWIGFFDQAELKRVSAAGGPALTLCRLTGAARGASWFDDTTIVFAMVGTPGLRRVAAGGGEPTVLTTPDVTRHEGNHVFPSVLPGGRGVLFTIMSGDELENALVAVLDLKTGKRKTLIRGGSHAEYVETGHLIYAAAGTLRAVRFDLTGLEVLSDPVPIVESASVASTGAANFGVSRTGTFVYVTGAAGGSTTPRLLVWVDRNGHETPINAPVRAYATPRLSPDGTRIAVDIHDQDNDIWVWNIAQQNLSRLTFGPALDQAPIWTRDSQRVIFASQRGGGLPNLYWQTADGTGTVDRLTTSANAQYPSAITPDGTHVVGFETFPEKGNDIALFPLVAPSDQSRTLTHPEKEAMQAEPLVQSQFAELNAEVSPNGRFIAYQSNESRRFDIYVRPFPNVNGGRWIVSPEGGTRPAWSRSGRELFYLDTSDTLTVVPVQTSGATFSVGNPTRVFDTRYAAPSPFRNYDIAPDGRFLMIKESAVRDPNTTPASIVMVLNWFGELKARVPTK
jgi:serine/threonine-protein kinase